MTEKMIENRIRKMQTLEKQIADLQKLVDEIKAELKDDLQEKGVDELETKNFAIRWREVVSNRLDAKALKAALPDVYTQFCKCSSSRRFTVA